MGELKCAECGASIDLDGDHWFYDDGRGYWHQDPLACEALRLRAENARLRECIATTDMMREMVRQDLDPHEAAKLYDVARAALDAGEEKR